MYRLFVFFLVVQVIFCEGLPTIVDDELKWPSKKSGEVYLPPNQFSNFLTMYHSENGTNWHYNLYRLNGSSEYQVYTDGEPKEGYHMKLWQATIDGEEFLIQVHSKNFKIFGADRERKMIKVPIKKIDNPAQGFVWHNYLFLDSDNAYDLKDALQNKDVKRLSLDQVKLADSGIEHRLEQVKNNCFEKDQFCAPYLKGTRNEGNAWNWVKSREVVLFFDEDSYMYVECGGEKVANKRCYYYIHLNATNTVYYIPQNLTSDSQNGVRTMLFPFVHLEDELIKPFTNLTKTTTTTQVPTTTPPKTTTTTTTVLPTTPPKTTTVPQTTTTKKVPPKTTTKHHLRTSTKPPSKTSTSPPQPGHGTIIIINNATIYIKKLVANFAGSFSWWNKIWPF